MSAFSAYLENTILDLVLRGTPYTPPSAVYLALFTNNPTDANTGSEVNSVGTGYSRKQMVFSSPSSNGAISNSNEILFDPATASFGKVTHLGVFDAETGGNLLIYGPVAESLTIQIGESANFPSGSVRFSIE